MSTVPSAWALPANAPDKLADLPKGYPLAGTTNLLLYSCYSSPAKRAAIIGMAALNYGMLGGTQTSDVSRFPPRLLTNPYHLYTPGVRRLSAPFRAGELFGNPECAKVHSSVGGGQSSRAEQEPATELRT